MTPQRGRARSPPQAAAQRTRVARSLTARRDGVAARAPSSPGEQSPVSDSACHSDSACRASACQASAEPALYSFQGMFQSPYPLLGLHGAVGAGVVDDVAADGHVVEPVGVAGAHAGAAVGDVGVALGADGPRGGVDELAGVGDPHRPLDVVDVVAVGAVDGDADGLGVHPLGVELLDDHLDARAGGELRLLAGGDRDGAEQLAVGDDLHLVGLHVHLVDVGVADAEVDLAVLLAVDAVAGIDAVDVEVDVDVGAGLPVLLRPVVDLGVAEPVPRAGLGRGGGDVMCSRSTRRSVTGMSKVTMTGMPTPTVSPGSGATEA